MKSLRITNASIFYAFVAGLCLASAIGIRLLRPVNTMVNDPTLVSLTQQAAQLRSFDTLALSRATELYNSSQDRIWDDKRIAEFSAKAADTGWLLQPIGSSLSVFTVNRRYLLRRADLSFTSWPDISRFICDASRSAGCTIENITIEAAPGETRSFSTFQAVISLPQRKPSVDQPKES